MSGTSETEDETRRWIVRWFAQRSPAAAPDWARDAEVDYFAAGWIDSFASVELIEDLEQTFRIRFTEEDLADPRFATLGGLVAIVQARRAAV